MMENKPSELTKLNSSEFISELSIQQIEKQVNLISDLMKNVLRENVHYGKIPGCGDKFTLLKPGLEKLCLTFRLRPEFEIIKTELENSHREYLCTCKLFHISTNIFLGEGVGSASTMEGKYRFRTGPSESTGKSVPREYWNLRRKNSGAAKELLGGEGFIPKKSEAGIWEIFSGGEKIENDSLADSYNTILKIAKKRSLSDGILATLAASDIFAEDDAADLKDVEKISSEKVIEDLIAGCDDLLELESLWNQINLLTKKRKQVLSKDAADKKRDQSAADKKGGAVDHDELFQKEGINGKTN